MGFSPLIWGRQAWHFIHMVALTYPNNPTEADKKNYLNSEIHSQSLNQFKLHQY